MFQDPSLQEHLETSSTIRTRSLVTAEWNMNIAEKIQQIGNYRYRPTEPGPYQYITASFNPDETDINDNLIEFPFFTGATDADVLIDGGYDEQLLDANGNMIPNAFAKPKDKEKMLYSLEDCFGKFRPRSGINKLRFFADKFSHYSHPEMARRPRYYMATRDDPFKYWTSYRTENGVERGISNKRINDQYFIDDAAPFVVYKEAIPANRIVVKMQTNTGDVDLGPFSNASGQFEDPFYGLGAGAVNKTTPSRWKIQYLESENGNWADAISFTQNSLRGDGVSPIVGVDGYVELGYGLIVPQEYRSVFRHTAEYIDVSLLPSPEVLLDGTAYLVRHGDEQGIYYVAINGAYVSFVPEYDWYLQEETVDNLTNYVTDLTSPKTFIGSADGQPKYQEFQYIYGLRVVVETMNKFDATFDLIELSPRLSVDISDKTNSFSITKSASDLGISGMPVGQLLASTGTLDIFDYDQSFFPENKTSIINQYTTQHIQFKFYEIIGDVDGIDYYIPIKTMYSEGFPSLSHGERSVSLALRDLFFYFETTTAPQVLIQNVSLSYAISMLLDYVGFSNYTFLRISDDELTIPFFSIGPDQSIAEVLNKLAVSAQAAMFFDEYNDFIVMSKEYIMPQPDQREISTTLRGSKDFVTQGPYQNQATGQIVDSNSTPEKRKLANIVDLASQNTTVYNDGQINYQTRYLQRSYRNVRQANFIDRDKTWIYKPALLWEITGDTAPRSVNDELNAQSAYSLAAIPLNTDLTEQVPAVVNNKVVNNIIDLGEGVYWLSRYNGYFFANGEVIRYDAVQYSVAGLPADSQDDETRSSIWISNVQEYQNYFSKVPFNGKIYPTGLVRIYSEPNYETIDGTLRLKNGKIAKHGRGQFNTSVVHHHAGLNPEWSSEEVLRGVNMDSRYLFSPEYSKTTKQVLDMSGNVLSDTIIRGEASIKNDTAISIRCVITGGTGQKTIFTSSNNGLKVDDILYLKTTGSLPTGLVNNRRYYVRSIVSENEFSISATKGGAEMSLSNEALATQSGDQSFVLLVEKTIKTVSIGISPEPDDRAEFTITDHGLSVGTPLFITTSGTLPVGIDTNAIYVVANVKNANVFTLKTIDNAPVVTSGSPGTGHTANILGYPATITVSNHRLLPGDRFSISTSGSLPLPLLSDTLYYVVNTGFSKTMFMLSLTKDGQKVTVEESQSGIHTLKADLTEQQIAARIVVPSVDNLAVGMYVEKLTGTGEIAAATRITAIDVEHKTIVINPSIVSPILLGTTNPGTGQIITNSLRFYEYIPTLPGPAGIDNDSGSKPTEKNVRAKTTTRNGIIKNFLTNIYTEESTVNRMFATQTGTIQSSALVMNGSESSPDDTTPGFVSYVYRKLDDRFTHFGSRMRIVGRITSDESRGQSPSGVNTYYTASGETVDKQISIGGAGGGIAVLINPETNNGYYFEIAALTDSKLNQYKASDDIHNVIFYKVERDTSAPDTAFGDSQKAIPVKLWGGVANIIVDDGQFTGQFRMATDENPTVYDLAVEYQKVGKALRFFLYINNNLVAIVDDENPPMVVNTQGIVKQTLDGDVATLQTASNHSLSTGTFITATDVYPGIAGRHKIISTTPNTISYNVSNTKFSIVGRQLESNIATIVTAQDHGFAAGDSIKVSGLTGDDEIFNGYHTLIGATDVSLVFALANDDIPAGAASGIVQYNISEASVIGTVSTIPEIAIYNNMALFIRGSSRMMFENVYALTNNYSQNTTFALNTVSDSVFSADEINVTDSFQRYAMSGIIQSTYLSGINSLESPKYNIYFEEFGTIMREAAYFNIRYDKAYPALYAKISQTFNRLKGYTVSGFIAGAYGAEFLVFNNTDTTLSLDSASGNYLRIQGITFTQQSDHELTVDEYYSKLSDLSNPDIVGDVVIRSPQQANKDYYDIKLSRMNYGRKDFSIEAAYIQSQDEANQLMGWLSKRVMKPRRSLGVTVFGLPTLQLGDIVDVDYVSENDEIFVPASSGGPRFVIYNIEYSRSIDGPETKIFLSEVTE